ncbi:transporter [Edaphobacter aggregans]|uniref:transporter n=1 Tax=Edaphobacter aggregans TaxID=570835 RepID=UPI000690A018|nr:transporter [Edaphobacter aggregans]
MRFVARLLTALGAVCLLSAGATAQDLEPRAYSASPVGTRFAGVGFGRSSGDITFDPTVPLTDVNATFYSPALGLGTTFGLFGRQALLATVVPYGWGNVTGNVGDQRGSVHRSGLMDIRTRLSVNLRGNPAMTPAEFAKRQHRSFIIGTSVSVLAPSGQYDNTKLINIGANRWAFKPEVGVSWPVKKLDLDLYAAVWLYTPNASFYPGTADRTQSALTALQAHVSYTVRRGLWAAFDATWYGGGSTRTNGGSPTERQANTRLGATLSIPVAKQQSVKIAYSSGVSGTIGASFSTISGGWQYVWFKR